jgi:hypothetical protein
MPFRVERVSEATVPPNKAFQPALVSRSFLRQAIGLATPPPNPSVKGTSCAEVQAAPYVEC